MTWPVAFSFEGGDPGAGVRGFVAGLRMRSDHAPAALEPVPGTRRGACCHWPGSAAGCGDSRPVAGVFSARPELVGEQEVQGWQAGERGREEGYDGALARVPTGECQRCRPREATTVCRRATQGRGDLFLLCPSGLFGTPRRCRR